VTLGIDRGLLVQKELVESRLEPRVPNEIHRVTRRHLLTTFSCNFPPQPDKGQYRYLFRRATRRPTNSPDEAKYPCPLILTPI
jgi:hypothetical protein